MMQQDLNMNPRTARLDAARSAGARLPVFAFALPGSQGGFQREGEWVGSQIELLGATRS